MKMKSRRIPIILFCLLAIFLFSWRIHRPVNLADHPPDETQANQSQTANLLPVPARTIPTNVFVASISEPTPESNYAALHETRLKQMAAEEETMQNEWRTPIEFYGVVEDESNIVVSGAKIDFDCNDLSSTGTSFYHTQSGANGTFSIKNITGKLLGVNVSKEGYYAYHPYGDNFYYAGQNQNFVPDAGNPVVFHFRKKGVAEALIHFHKNFHVPRDGTPVLVDLATGNLTQSSDNSLEVEGWTHDNEKKQGWKYDWKCQVSVPAGGLQTNDDQFPFLAPNSNYVASDLIDMTVKQDIAWSEDVERSYYVVTGDGKYARLTFRMIAHADHFCTIDCFFNPSGSRNLEPAQ